MLQKFLLKAYPKVIANPQNIPIVLAIGAVVAVAAVVVGCFESENSKEV